MNLLVLIFIGLFGLIIGSFLAAWTYRLGEEISINEGRSFCPKCKKTISWYDNIPLFSYVLLRGKCRHCGAGISMRYPIIEFVTATVFLTVFVVKSDMLIGRDAFFTFIYFYTVSAILIAIFVTDFENKLIPDVFSLYLISVALLFTILFREGNLFEFLFSGFAASAFLLVLNLATKGKGMGLGDVKLALFGGIFLGFPQVVTWLFLSFTTGAFVGIILILIGKTRFGKKIAFGPFMVFSFFVVFFWGNSLTNLIVPYL